MTRQLRGATKGPAERLAPGRHILSPEAVDEKDAPWSVSDSTEVSGMTDNHARRMRAPLNDDSPQAASVRMHELMHARMTPANLIDKGHKKYGVTVDSLNACEDHRINLAARRNGIQELYDTPLTDGQVAGVIEGLCNAAKAISDGPSLVAEASSRIYHKAACAAASLAGTRHESLAYNIIRENAPNDVFYQLHYANCELAYSRNAKDGNKSANATIRAGRKLDQILQRHEVLAKAEARKNAGTFRPDSVVKPPPKPIEDGDCDVMINHLRLFTPPLSEVVRKKARTYRKTADTGRLWRPTEAMRLDGSGLPFRRKMKTPMGCAVLIDSSGSMGFGQEELAEIIKDVPGALVMLHAAGANESHTREIGTFAVVGKDGHVISLDQLDETRQDLGGGNMNDAACVLLAGRLADKYRIKGPRFWVTDMGWGNHQGVIGIGSTRSVGTRCAKRAKFEIVRNVREIWA